MWLSADDSLLGPLIYSERRDIVIAVPHGFRHATLIQHIDDCSFSSAL